MDSSIRMNALPAALPGSTHKWAHDEQGGRSVQRAESTQGRGRVHGQHEGHEHRRMHGHGGSERTGSEAASYATLKISIQQTLSKLATPDDSVETASSRPFDGPDLVQGAH